MTVVLSDKCAFFLVSHSDAGAQFYELVANSVEDKNKFVHLLYFFSGLLR